MKLYTWYDLYNGFHCNWWPAIMASEISYHLRSDPPERWRHFVYAIVER